MSGRRGRWRAAALFLLLPLSLLLNEIAARNAQAVETLYGRGIYPRLAWGLGKLNGFLPFSLAELLLAFLLLAGLWRILAAVRRQWASGRRWGTFLLRSLLTCWAAAGGALFLFLLLWGLNYARPGLARKMEIAAEEIQPEEILAAGRRMAALTAAQHAALGLPSSQASRLPLAFPELDRALGEALHRAALPGYRLGHPASPAKRLLLSPLFCYLGISGIFIPFTGEPSVNSRIPDCGLPLAVAHEKAHQLGITDEGEANLAAFLACTGATHPYLRYSALLDAAARLLAAASRVRREEARAALQNMGPGPLADLAAIRDFWASYHGPLSRGAERVNDAYLKSLRVREGVESYERIVELLIALDRKGRLLE
jgi:hypothetical protein